MNHPVEYLDLDDLVRLATELLGRPPQIRDAGLLASAAARPQASLMGEDAYPDLWQKAGALLQSIVKGHALVDGNKRLGWLATAVFLELNGIDVTMIPNDDVYRSMMEAAADQREVHELAGELHRLIGG